MNIYKRALYYLNDDNNILKWVLFLLIALGCFIRLHFYFDYKDLWLDEAFLAKSIFEFSFYELLTQELLNRQSSPLGFVLLAKLLTFIAQNEFMLYLPSLVSGISLIFLSYIFTKKYFDDAFCIVYMSIFMMCISLVYYSIEFKQYMLESLLGFFLVWYYMNNKEEMHISISFKTLLVMIVASLFSSSSPFIICGITCAILYNLGALYKIFNYIKNNFFNILLFIAFYAIYFFKYLSLTSVSWMQDYWKKSFLPLNIEDFIPWFKDVFLAVMEKISYVPFEIYGYKTGGIFFLVFFVYGACILFKKDKNLFFCTVIPFLITLVASACKMYPMGHSGILGTRFVLFLYPIVLIPMAVAILHLINLFLKNKKIVNIVLIFISTISIVANVLYLTSFEHKVQQTVESISFIRENYTKDTTLIIEKAAKYTYELYFKDEIIEYINFDHSRENIIDIVEQLLKDKKSIMLALQIYETNLSQELIEYAREKGFAVICFKDIGSIVIYIYKA